MVVMLTRTQRDLVGLKVAKEIRFKRKALMKRRAGKSLSEREQRATTRKRKQLIAIGFSKARAEDPSIPEVETNGK